ncbi:hypothetical protein [Colwellia hornerae]|uniref:Uncharacterized protein n=1 Tax=Colwellia hornerae TaxID=89402 RepID=A0A5C6QJJ0_9GAMM|nr:hypothetical protein [Colwellia hornerae]TWX53376.1 hypothetical protein ESZ28_10015 [Colwellia hornerae]TWX60196.1 hypothetical protein ESZ26_08790 [Colwellia hornerae]TWX69011.1 hypothetical protein ESZ27_06640 [Colwellia hornerae]
MTKNALILASDIIEQAQHSGRRAGTSLEAIASEHGDEKMLAVLTEMDILTVAKIVREHDATIPSIATWLMDAESIKQLLNVEPSYWQNIDEDHVFCAQTEAHSLLTQIFLSSDDEEKQREVLTAIVEDDFGLLYLSLPFIGHDFSEIEEDEEQTSGSIEELLMKIKTLSEEAYREVMTVSSNGTLDNIENALKQNANKQRVTAVEMDTDDMFAPL